jgi:hypothetical protein
MMNSSPTTVTNLEGQTMTVIDTPQGIANFRLLAGISALSLELRGMTNSHGSVYKVILKDYFDEGALPARATLANKCIMMQSILENLTPEALAGPVCTLARTTLDEVLAENGWVLTT